MAGDVKVAVVNGALNQGETDTTDFTKLGFGTPKACIIIAGFDQTDNAATGPNSNVSIGFSDFTNNYSITHQDKNTSAKVDCDARKSNTACYIGLEIGGGVDGFGTASTITDGVRLTNGAVWRFGNTFFTVIMLGGADLSVSVDRTTINSSEDGTATITPGEGFDTSLIFFIGTDVSGEDSSSSGINNSFGVCHINAPTYDTFTQRCMGWASDHGNNDGSPSAIISTEHVLDIVTEAGGEDWALEVTAAATNSITVMTRDNGAGAGMEVYSLALDLDDRSAKVGSVDSPTSGATWAPSVSLGFTPQYVGLGLTGLASENSIAIDAEAGVHGISSNTGSGEETCYSWYNEDAAATTNTNSLFRSRTIDFRDHDVTTVVQDHSHSSFDSGGWTYTINTENEDTARKWFYWAIEEAPAGEITGEGAQLLQTLSQAGTGVMLPSGVGAQLLELLAQDGIAVMLPTGVGTQLLELLAQVGVGTQEQSATGAQLLKLLAQAGTGVQAHSGTSVQLLALLAQAGVAVMLPSAVGAQLLELLAQAGVGVHEQSATGVQLLELLAQDGTAVMLPSGTGIQLLELLAQAGEVTHGAPTTAAGAQLLALLAQVGIGAIPFLGAGAQLLELLAQVGTGSQEQSGTGAQLLELLEQDGSGVQTYSITSAQLLEVLAQAGTGIHEQAGVGAQLLELLAQAGVGEQTFSSSGAQALVLLSQEAGVVVLAGGAGIYPLIRRRRR